MMPRHTDAMNREHGYTPMVVELLVPVRELPRDVYRRVMKFDPQRDGLYGWPSSASRKRACIDSSNDCG